MQDVRAEARDAIAAYLRALIGIVLLPEPAPACSSPSRCATARPRLRYTIGAAGDDARRSASRSRAAASAGQIDEPQYYAFGPDIPRALQAVEAAQQSHEALDQELDAQLVGLARLVTRPGERTPLTTAPTITIASDLHNNFLALPILERAASGGPLFFAGDLTDRGSPLEARRAPVVDLGKPFVFVSGNHDCDSLERDLARRGANVLTESGRLNADGSYGNVIDDVDGLKVAATATRSSAAGEKTSRTATSRRSTPEPAGRLHLMAASADREGRRGDGPRARADRAGAGDPPGRPPERPLVFVVGHTHKAHIDRCAGVNVVNGGSVGAGGTGNLTEQTKMGSRA